MAAQSYDVEWATWAAGTAVLVGALSKYNGLSSPCCKISMRTCAALIAPAETKKRMVLALLQLPEHLFWSRGGVEAH